MPILRYRCITCGKEFPKIITSPDKAPTKCIVCGAEPLQELGEAFIGQAGTLERFLCQSCDSCSDNGNCDVTQQD